MADVRPGTAHEPVIQRLRALLVLGRADAMQPAVRAPAGIVVRARRARAALTPAHRIPSADTSRCHRYGLKARNRRSILQAGTRRSSDGTVDETVPRHTSTHPSRCPGYQPGSVGGAGRSLFPGSGSDTGVNGRRCEASDVSMNRLYDCFCAYVQLPSRSVIGVHEFAS